VKIVETLRKEADSHEAIIEVDVEEVADLDAMVLMVDGLGGDYSVDVRLVSTSNLPKIENIGGHRIPFRKHNMCPPAEYLKRKRYFEIRMSRN